MFWRLLFITLLAIPLYLGAEVKILRTVNGEAISNLDVRQQVRIMEKLSNLQFTEAEKKAVFTNALESLTDEIIIMKKAQEMHVEISDGAVMQALESMTKKNAADLKKYVQQNNINYQDLIKKTKAQMMLEKIIAAEIAPHITVSDKEVKRYYNTVYELEKDDKYLGLFSNNDLSEGMLNNIRKMKVGTTSGNLKLLDKFNVNAKRLYAKFNTIKIIDQNKESIDQLIAAKINCKNYSQMIDKSKALVKNDLTQGFNAGENEIYKKILKKKLKAQQNLAMDGGKTLLLVCDVTEPDNTDQIIREKIFHNKISNRTVNYLKNLRKSNTIVMVDNEK